MEPIPKLEDIIKFYPEFDGVHPILECFPMISPEDFWELVEHIRVNGVATNLMREKGTNLLIDGRARLLALDITGSLFEVTDIEPEYVLAHVTASNLHGMQFAKGEKEATKAKLLPFYKAQSERRAQQ